MPALAIDSTKPAVHRKRVTFELVAAACEELGDDVSVRNVRALLAGGSLRDIGPKVRDWKAARGPREGQFTPTAADRLAVVGARVDMRLRDHAQTQAVESHKVHRELSELKRDVERLSKVVKGHPHDDAPRASGNVVALPTRTAAPVELNRALDAITTRLAGLEQRVPTADTLTAPIGALATTLRDAITELTSQVSACAQAVAEIPVVPPVVRVDAALEGQLHLLADQQRALGDLIAHARPDLSGTAAIVGAIRDLGDRTARVLQRQARRTTTSQAALIERVDALVSKVAKATAPTRPKAKARTNTKRKAPPRARAPRAKKPLAARARATVTSRAKPTRRPPARSAPRRAAPAHNKLIASRRPDGKRSPARKPLLVSRNSSRPTKGKSRGRRTHR